MNPAWKNKLTLLHKRINEADASFSGDMHDEPSMRGDHSMKPLSFKEDSIALIDPAFSMYNAPSPRSYTEPLQRDLNWEHSLHSTSHYIANDIPFNEYDNDFSASEVLRHEDSSDHVNQGTPTKAGGDSSSSKSTPSPATAVARNQPALPSSSSNKTAVYLNSVLDSRVLDYDPLSNNVLDVSYSSTEDSDRNVIKKIDFGASIEMRRGDLDSFLDENNESNHGNIAVKSVTNTVTTPPKSNPVAAFRPALSPPLAKGSGGDTQPAELKLPCAASPSSPEIKSSTFSRTPSRVNMPSVSRRPISPTQERSTSKFADALRQGNDGYDSDDDVLAPLNMSNTIGIPGSVVKAPRSHVGHMVQRTPQAKTSSPATTSTPATQSKQPPTPTPTPGFSHYTTEAASNSQNSNDLTAYTEGYDEWKEAWTPVGKKYFYNRRTRKSTWRLPPSAVYVKVPGEYDKIFVPVERDVVSTMLSGSPLRRGQLALVDKQIDELAETVATSALPTAVRMDSTPNRRRSSNLADKASAVKVAAKEDVDWGSERQVIVKTELKMLDPKQSSIAQASSQPAQSHSGNKAVDKINPETTAPRQEAFSSTPVTSKLGTPSEAYTTGPSTHSAARDMKCKTLLFCPLCADVILPHMFGNHFSECPEMATLVNNGEFNIVFQSLRQGVECYSRHMKQALGDRTHEFQCEGPSCDINEILPNRALNFDAVAEESNSEIESDLAAVAGDVKHHANQSPNRVPGGSVPHNMCVFCKKPFSKSALSAHLLICKSRKQLQQKRQVEQQDPSARGNASVGRSRSAVAKRTVEGHGTPQRAGRDVLTAPSTNTQEGGLSAFTDDGNRGYWGAGTPANIATRPRDALDHKLKYPAAGTLNVGEFVSPEGVVEGIYSGVRGPVETNQTPSNVKKQHSYLRRQSSSPLKTGPNVRSAHKKPLGEHNVNATPSNRAIATRVFL